MGTTKIYKPDQDHSYGSQPISLGGTGARTKEQAAENLGIIPHSKEGIPGGVGELDAEGYVKEQFYPKEVGDIAIPTLDGPTFLVIGTEYIYYISNYDSSVIYTVSVTGATWHRDEDRIYVTADGSSTDVTITINGKVFSVSSASRAPEKPTITYPTEDLVIDSVNITAIASAFVPGATMEPHLKSRWMLADDIALSNLLQDQLLDTAISCEFDGLPMGKSLFIGVQYSSASGFSPLSNVREFITQATQILAPQGVATDQSDETQIKIKIDTSLFKTNTVRKGPSTPVSPAVSSGTVNLSGTNIGVELEASATGAKPIAVVIDGQTYTFSNTATQRVMFDKVLSNFTYSKTAGADTTLSYRLLTAAETHVSTDWEVSEQPNFSTTVQSYSDDTSNKLSRLFVSLEYGKTYYFRARYKSAQTVGSWSNTISLSTLTYIEKPTIASPMNNAINQDTSFTITANDYVGHPGSLQHVSSDWEVYDDVALTNAVIAVYGDTVNKTTYLASGLEHGKIYYLRVRFHAAGVDSEWSNTVKITTSNYIAQPTITYPGVGESVYETTVTLQSDAFMALPATQTHTSSDWQLATDAAFTNIVQSVNADTANKTSWTVSGLTYGESYFARVRYRSNAVVSAWSDVTNVNVSNDITPAITSPANNAIDTPTSLTITANNPFSSNPSVHISSDWEIATDVDFTNVVLSNIQTVANKYQTQFDGLSVGVNYYTRVRFNLSSTSTNWSNPVKFTTGTDHIPVINTPVNNSVDLNRVIELTVNRSDVEAVNAGSTALSAIHWQISKDANFTTIHSELVENNYQYDGSNLLYTALMSVTDLNTDYYLRIRYVFGLAKTPWSDVNTFKTVARILRITPSLTTGEYTDWNLDTQGPLVIDGDSSKLFFYEVSPVIDDFEVQIKAWGASGSGTRDYGGYGGPGGYAGGKVPLTLGQTYSFAVAETSWGRDGRQNWPGGGPIANDSTAGGGGGYTGFFYGGATQTIPERHDNSILIAGGGGGSGLPQSPGFFGDGGSIAVGGAGGSVGDGSDTLHGAPRPNGSVDGTGLVTGGTQTAGGIGESAGARLSGGYGHYVAFYVGEDEYSQPIYTNKMAGGGGAGYYGGGSGQAVTDRLGTGVAAGHPVTVASGGGGGSSYYKPGVVSNPILKAAYVSIVYWVNTGRFKQIDVLQAGNYNDTERGNAGDQGYPGRIIFK